MRFFLPFVVAVCLLGWWFLRPHGPAVSLVTYASNVKNFSLLDEQGNYFELFRQQKAKAVVLISHRVGCPIIEKNLPRIEQLRQRYEAQGVQFFLINGEDSRETLREHRREFGIQMPILRDTELAVLTLFNVSRTSAAIVIDPANWRLIYEGAIDDRLGYRTDKPEAGHAYLADALDAFLAGRKVTVARTEANGCVIEPPPATHPTYADVAPILQQKCLNCHGGANGARPNAFDSYEELRTWLPMIHETLMTKRMPPWDPDPEVGKFANDISLKPAEFRTLIEWIRTGAPKGDRAPKLVEDAGPKRKFQQNLVFELPQEIVVPATETRPWRYSPVITDAKETLLLSALAIQDEAITTQHSNLIITKKPWNFADTDYEPQFKNMEDVYYILRFNPASRRKVFRFPPGMALRIPKGYHVILSQHFPVTGKEVRAHVRVEMETYKEKKKPKEPKYDIAFASPEQIQLPAGAAAVPVQLEKTLSTDGHLWRMTSHMHLRGRAVRVFITKPGKERELIYSVPEFSYAHSNVVELAQPIFLPKGTRVNVEGTFDNSPGNPAKMPWQQPISWGADLEKNEMLAVELIRY